MADPPVFMSITPSICPVVIIDAMFIINTKPLGQTKTFTDNAYFLFNQYEFLKLAHWKFILFLINQTDKYLTLNNQNI